MMASLERILIPAARAPENRSGSGVPGPLALSGAPARPSKTFKTEPPPPNHVIQKSVEVNGTSFQITLTDQVIQQVHHLKSLYETAYEDPESFEQVSSDISNAIREISTAADPPPSDGDLDNLMQEIIKVVDNKSAEMQKQMDSKPDGTH